MALAENFKSIIVALCTIAILAPSPLFAGEAVDKAGEVTGITLGNVVFVPLKLAIMGFAAPVAAISWLGSLGDTKQVKAIWKDSTDQPYFISPGEAKRAVGRRPDLNEDWNPARDHDE